MNTNNNNSTPPNPNPRDSSSSTPPPAAAAAEDLAGDAAAAAAADSVDAAEEAAEKKAEEEAGDCAMDAAAVPDGPAPAPATVFRIRLKQPPSNLRHKMSVPELCRNFRSASFNLRTIFFSPLQETPFFLPCNL